MSDGVDITHGGAIAVDTEALRGVARGIAALAPLLTDAAAAIQRAHGLIVDVPGAGERVDTVALWGSSERVAALQAECRDAVTGTNLMADAYELVELRAQMAALDAADAAAADALWLRIERLEASDSRLAGMADLLVAQWERERYEGLHGQFALGAMVTGLGLGVFTGTAAALGARGHGKIPAGSVLTGVADPVRVRPVATSSPIAPPASLADAFRRFPTASGAQVKIERYTMSDGTARFVLYAKGTQSGLYGAGDPWDMKSNHELYAGRRSASYQAALDALQAAGARPGDRVDAFAHSQAGMITARLAMESEYDVRLQVTAGSPVEPTLDEDQLLVQLRHTDDVVSALAGGGSSAGTGSPDSFVAERVGHPGGGWEDYRLQTHLLPTYIETAELVDASGDARVSSVQQELAGLSEAVAIESTEYQAERTGWAQ